MRPAKGARNLSARGAEDARSHIAPYGEGLPCGTPDATARPCDARAVTRDALLAVLTAYYLDSRDFNGLPVVRLDIPRQQLEPMLRALIEDALVSIPVTGGNPHIRAFPSVPIEAQLAELDRVDDLTHVVAYPEPKHLEASVDRNAFDGRPYTLRLALGAGQLEPAFFELSILEQYRNDPRYRYDTNETAGTISVTDEHYASEAMREADKVILQTFGFGYDDAMHRAVCVFNRYLSDLSPEHQQIWKARELAGGYKLHPAYYASSILGEFPDGISMFDAFLEELELLKAMPEAVDLPPLVRESFRGSKPGNFTFLIRPTLKETPGIPRDTRQDDEPEPQQEVLGPRAWPDRGQRRRQGDNSAARGVARPHRARSGGGRVGDVP